MWASRQRALTATTDITLMRAPLTAITGLPGSQAECSSALARGITDIGAAVGVTATTDAPAGAMVTAMWVVEAIMGALAMRDAGMRAEVSEVARSTVPQAEVFTVVAEAASTAAGDTVVAGIDNRP
jgi:hypothetical protein